MTWAKEAPKPPKTIEEIRLFVPPERDITVPKRIHHIGATRQALRRSRPESYGFHHVRGESFFETRISLRSLDRAMWMWWQLVEAIKKADLRIDILGATWVTNGQERVWIELKERFARFHPEGALPKKRFSWQTNSEVEEVAVEHAPTGYLMFRAENPASSYSSRKWMDSSRRPLEDRLDEIIEGLHVLLAAKAEKREKDRLSEIERQAEEAERNRRWDLAQEEAKRRRRLREFASDFRRANQIWELTEAIERMLGPDDEGYGADWLDWARRVSEELNPAAAMARKLMAGVDPTREQRYGSCLD